MGPAGQQFGAAGLRVAGVLPGSMAEEAALAAGDELVDLDGWPVDAPAALRAALQRLATRDRIELGACRDAAAFRRSIAVRRWPRETVAGQRICYEQIEVDGLRLRTIVSVPEAPGPHPAVLFLQGIRPGTVDFAFDTTAPVCQLVHGFARSGFATVRLERRGTGDSEGGPLAREDFWSEVGDYRAALQALAARPDIDRQRIFLFGHSVGGMIAPLLAAAVPLRGIVVYGTASAPWAACVRASMAQQRRLRGEEAAGDGALAHFDRALAGVPGAPDATIFGRSAAFHRQLAAADIAGAWAATRVAVLVLHGAFDWVVARGQGQELAARLAARGCPVEYVEIPGLDHTMTWHASREDSIARYGQGCFAHGMLAGCVHWLREEGRR